MIHPVIGRGGCSRLEARDLYLHPDFWKSHSVVIITILYNNIVRVVLRVLRLEAIMSKKKAAAAAAAASASGPMLFGRPSL